MYPRSVLHQHADQLYMSLIGVLKWLFAQSTNLRRNIPYGYNTFAALFLASFSQLTSCLPLTMAISSFGPYCCLRAYDAPAEGVGITPTPWTMMPTLGFV